MNPTAIYSKSGKGVQEAAGKTSLLTRPDRAVLSAIDGRATLADVAQKVGKTFDNAFATLVATLDKNGFIREVSAGAGAAAAPKPAAAAPPPPKPAAAAAPKPAPRPAAKAADDGGDLDFSSLSAAAKPATPPPAPPKEQQSALNKAREEAEAKAQAERDRLKKEVEAKTRAEMEAKLRAEAEKKIKDEAEAKVKAATTSANLEADARVKAARDAALKAAEAKVRLEQESKAKLDAERKAREETERRLEVERKGREEAERKAKEEGERARKEAEEKARREAEDLRQKLEEERKAREVAERRAKEEAERVRKELEEERKRLEAERKREEEERAARRKREEEEAQARRKQREEEDRKAEEERAAKKKQREEEHAAREREEEEQRAAKKKQREEQAAAREQEEEAQREAARAAKQKQREEEEAAQAAVVRAAPAPAPKAEAKPPPKKDSFADSLLADLDNFTNKEEEEAKAKEEAERKAKAEAERQARAEAERQAKEEAERRKREEEEQRRKDEEARRAAEEEQRHAQEEERRKREAEEIRRKAEAATAAAMAKEGKKAPGKAAAGDDIPVTEDDLDMDEVAREQAVLAKGKEKEKEKEKEREKKEKKKKPVAYDEPARSRRPAKWGKPVAMTLGLLLVIVVAGAQFVPIGTADYERVATEALGRPVKIGSANLWLLTGPQVRLHDVSVGDAKIKQVTAFGSPGAIFGDKKEFSRLELDGLRLPQEAIGDALFATVRGDNFSVDEIVVKSLEVPGPATLPKNLQAELRLSPKGTMRNAIVRGPDGLLARITATEEGVDFDVHAAGFPLPIAPQVVLSTFAMKGSATRRGMTITEWAGAIFGGAISGTANVNWSGDWKVEGVVTVRNINAAVFAPTLLSSGNAEGTGKFSMNGPDAGALAAASRIDGNFTVSKGTLGSFDLVRAIQSSGKQYAGSTQFSEMNGRAIYDRGAVSLRDVTIGAGALNAGATADIAQNGALSGRIVADMKTAAQTLRGTLLLGGTVKEPQVRN